MDVKSILKKITSEFLWFVLFLVLGILIMPPLGQKFGILSVYQDLLRLLADNLDVYFLILIPYTVFIVARTAGLLVSGSTVEEIVRKKIFTLITREAFYLTAFFVLGCAIMPWVGRTLGLMDHNTSTLRALFNFEPAVYLLAAIPYLVFVFVRICLYYLRKCWLGGHYDYEYENVYTLSDFKNIMLVVVALFLVSFILYVFNPKPVYKEFYGRSKICECFGHKKTIDPNEWFWGQGNKEWGVCFGLLTKCK